MKGEKTQRTRGTGRNVVRGRERAPKDDWIMSLVSQTNTPVNTYEQKKHFSRPHLEKHGAYRNQTQGKETT